MAYQPQRTGTPTVDRNLDKISAELAQQASLLTRLGGTVHTGFAVGTGDTTLFHGLGRIPTGYVVIGRSVAATVFDGSATADPRQSINLRASAPVTVSLLVF